MERLGLEPAALHRLAAHCFARHGAWSDPVRHALKSTRPGGKPQSHQKYWQELRGQVGGRVGPPMLELTEAEKAATRAAFEACGLGKAPLAKAG